MPNDTPSHRGGRGYGQRGRRGHDRRGPERRPSPTSGGPSPRAEHVDVEHIMRDIRARISKQHGIDLTDQQVRDLAARRLESILDVRTLNPALLNQLTRAVAADRGTAATPVVEPPYRFEDTTLYDSHRGILRSVRRLLNPILKLFFNPGPLVTVLNTQARLNVEAAERERQRDERQAEWNALHYEIVGRLATEVARASLEAQRLALQVESLSAKVDFNERRVRGLEGSLHELDTRPRASAPAVPRPASDERPPQAPGAAAPPGESAASDGQKRRRRRRRGRRPLGVSDAAGVGAADPSVTAGLDSAEDFDGPDDMDSGVGDEPDVRTAATATADLPIEPEPAGPAPAEPTVGPVSPAEADDEPHEP